MLLLFLKKAYAYINPTLFRKTVLNFIVPKNFTELQVNYTKLETQYFLSLIKNETFNESVLFSSIPYSSIYSIDIDSDGLSEKSNSSTSTLYYKSPISNTSQTDEISKNILPQSSKRSLVTDICDNSLENNSHKRICIKLDS